MLNPTVTSHLVPAAVGGVLTGLAVAGLWVLNGRAAGISGIFGGVLELDRPDLPWRSAFLGGLALGGLVLSRLAPRFFTWDVPHSSALLIASGLLVGFGTRLGSGCTSGHGLCGISRLSGRSIVATLVFMALGMVAVFVLRHALGGAA
ncbi:MAG: YeeE/YedE family protein [Deltaproteobacteria bacterium]|nr:YeeE/YedE family protein [Deltaproteobacteria bacterium]